MLRSVTRIGATGLLLAAAGAATATFASGTPQRTGVTTRVTVTVSRSKCTLSRKTVPVGVVAFGVVNRDKVKRDFQIRGKKTPLIKAGKSVTLKVAFSKGGRYAYVCVVPGHAAADKKGVLAVLSPTRSTTTTTTTYPGPGGTVQVSEFEFGFTLSPTTVPSGNVTFVMRNTGTIQHNFHIEGVKAGPFLNPGHSATFVVNLRAGQKYTYLCDVPGHAAAGMIGAFTPSP